MYNDQLDEDLAHLRAEVADQDIMAACALLAAFAVKLDRVMKREERMLRNVSAGAPVTPRAFAMVRGEHASLRHLVSRVATALDTSETPRALDAIGKLRSVLMVHAAKEASLLERGGYQRIPVA